MRANTGRAVDRPAIQRVPETGGPQLRRALAGAATLDVVGAGRPARQHSRFGGPDDGPVQPGSAAASARLTPRKQPAVPT